MIHSAEGRRMTVEIISLSISTKVWDQAGIELATPGSAVSFASVTRHVTDCATRLDEGEWDSDITHRRSWRNQPAHQQHPLGNLLLSAETFFSGCSPVKVINTSICNTIVDRRDHVLYCGAYVYSLFFQMVNIAIMEHLLIAISNQFHINYTVLSTTH